MLNYITLQLQYMILMAVFFKIKLKTTLIQLQLMNRLETI